MPRGGFRPNAGRKPMSPEAKAQRRREADERTQRAGGKIVIAAPAEPKRMRMPGASELEHLLQLSKAYGRRPAPDRTAAFMPAQHPPTAMPVDTKLRMAMDDSLSWAGTQWAGAVLDTAAANGLAFLGYPYLSQLAQQAEYRTIAETIADDATRKWIDFEVTGDEAENRRRKEKDPDGEAERMADPDERKKRVEAAGKMDKVKALKDDQERLEVRDRFYEISRDDSFFGRDHLYIDFGADISTQSAELRIPIGNGRDAISQGKVEKGKLIRRLQTIEPVWVYPTTYNATNPLSEDWYNPKVWYVMGTEIDRTRLLTFVGHPVPDLLKPAYSFGGVSLSQLAQPYIDIWLRTRTSVGDLIHSFSVMVLETDMATVLQGGPADNLMVRAMMFNGLRDNNGLMMINKATEGFNNVTTSLAGLHELQAQAQEHIMSVARIPAVKYTGIQPAGLNASSEGEIQVYDDTIAGYQNRLFRPNLTRVVNFEQLTLFGEVDPEITIVFNPLRVMTEKEKAELQKQDMERDTGYVDMGALAPEEIRARIIDDPELPYADLDPDDVPDLQEEEAAGLEPGGGNNPVDNQKGAVGAKDESSQAFDEAIAILDRKVSDALSAIAEHESPSLPPITVHVTIPPGKNGKKTVTTRRNDKGDLVADIVEHNEE